MIGRRSKRTMLRSASAAFLFALAGSSSAAAPAPNFYLELDGHWYVVAQATGNVFQDSYGIYMPTAIADSCVRADGQPQAYGGFGMYLGQYFFPVYHLIAFRYHPRAGNEPFIGIWIANTLPGNIVCNHEVHSPLDRIFHNGFEPPDHIFSAGFEATP